MIKQVRLNSKDREIRYNQLEKPNQTLPVLIIQKIRNYRLIAQNQTLPEAITRTALEIVPIQTLDLGIDLETMETTVQTVTTITIDQEIVLEIETKIIQIDTLNCFQSP